MITAQGELVYELEEGTINSERYIEFLRRALANHPRPIVTVHSPLPLAREGLGVRVVDSTTDPLTLTLTAINLRNCSCRSGFSLTLLVLTIKELG